MQGGSQNIDGIIVPNPSTAGSGSDNNIQNKNSKDDFGRVLYSWSAPSFIHKDKGAIWFLVVGLFFAAIEGWLIYQKDWFAVGVFAILAIIVFWYVAKVRPTEEDYSITQLGIIYGERFYPFSEIHSFWVVYDQKVKVLYIAFLKKYLPALTIHLDSADPIQVKSILVQKIPEQDKRGENFLDRLVRIIGL